MGSSVPGLLERDDGSKDDTGDDDDVALLHRKEVLGYRTMAATQNIMRVPSGVVLARVVFFLVFFSGQSFLCSSCGLRPYPSFASVFSLVALEWTRGWHRKSRQLTSEPSDSPAHCSSLLAPTFLPTYLHLTLLTDASTYASHSILLVLLEL